MSTLDALATALQAMVGKEHLLTQDAAAPYAVDGVSPSMVVLPADAEQTEAILRLTEEHQATVFPRGGGSHMALGHPPARVDVVLSLQRLQQQIAYEPADMTTTVQAGLRLAALQQTLGQQGQFLGLDPPAGATTTAGGIVAANLSGPRRLLYGSARDLLLGLTVITADGTRTKAGGRVVKNVTGYDLNKLYIGSLGTLAVIVDLTFKIHPLPPGEHTVALAFSRQTDIAPMLQTAVQLPLRLSSLELLNTAAITWLMRSAALPALETPYLLMARMEGTSEVLRKQEQRLIEAMQQLLPGASLTVHTWSPEEQDRLWHSLAEFPVAMHTAAPQGVMAKVSLRMSDLPVLFQEVQTLGDVTWPLLAHAGNGIAYVSIPPAQGATPDPAAMLRHIQSLDACVARLQGHRVLQRAPVEVKRQCEVWGTPGDAFGLMRALKASFDPRNRLNPGRFIGGL